MKVNGATYLCFLLLLTACSDQPESFSERERIAVRFSLSGIQAEVSTRADGDGTSPLAEGTTLRIFAFKDGKYINEGTYTANTNGSLTGVNTLLLPQGTYDFYALTPSSVAVDKTNNPCTVSVNHGVDYASSTEATTATVKENSSSVELKVLTRHCSKLIFNFSPKYDNVTSVEIRSAELTNMTNEPVVGMLNTSLPIESADKTTSVTLSNKDFIPTTGKPLEYSASTIVLPRKAGGFDFKMAACFNGNTTETVYSAPLPADLPLLPGYQYTFTVKMKGDAAELELGVAPWGDEYFFNTDMGEYYTIELTVENGWQDVPWNDGDSLGE